MRRWLRRLFRNFRPDSGYTPSFSEVRQAYVYRGQAISGIVADQREAEFSRWVKRHDAGVLRRGKL